MALPDPGPEGLVGRVDADPGPDGAEPVGHLVGVVLVVVLHAEHPHLLGGQPGGQGAGIVLEQDGEEPLHRTEQGPVDHDRPVPAVVGPDVLHLEALRELEVQLDGGHLVGPADGVLGLHGDLRPVEGAATLVEDQVEVHGPGGRPEGLGGFVPLLDRAHRLALGPGGQLEVEVVEPEVTQQGQDEVQRGVELVDHLLAGAEDVGVVLGHAPDPGQPVHDPGLLVAVDGAELEQAHGQLAVGPLSALEDQDVERAVHRLQVVLLTAVELHGREHPLGEPVEVARGLEQLGLGDVRGVDELVADGLVALVRE